MNRVHLLVKIFKAWQQFSYYARHATKFVWLRNKNQALSVHPDTITVGCPAGFLYSLDWR